MGGGLWAAGSGILVEVAGAESAPPGRAGVALFAGTAGAGRACGVRTLSPLSGPLWVETPWGRPCAVMPWDPAAAPFGVSLGGRRSS